MPTGAPISVRRFGNVIGIRPTTVFHLIAPHLTWQRRYRNPQAGRTNAETGKKHPYYLFSPEPLYRMGEDELFTFAGLWPRLESVFSQLGWEYEYVEQKKPKLPKPSREGLGYLRGRQAEVLELIWAADYGTIVCPTAWGKSEMIAKLCLSYPISRVVIVSPGLDAVHNIAKRLESYGIDAGVVRGGKNEQKRITVCSADSLMKVDLTKADLVMFDEVHRAAAPKTRESLVTAQNAVMLGFTASDKGRGDNGELLVEALFGPPLCEIQYEEAVEAGHVAPIVVIMMQTRGNAVDVQDATAKSRNMIWRNKLRNEDFACAAESVATFSQTLVMTAVLEHALNLRALLTSWPVVYGTAPADVIGGTVSYGWFRAMQLAKRISLEAASVPGLSFTEEDVVRLREWLSTGNDAAIAETYPWVQQLDWHEVELRAKCSHQDYKKAVHDRELALEMQRLGVDVITPKDRAAIADAFKTGQINNVIATQTWSTAVDFPSLEVLFRADGGTSEILSTQIPGRASRKPDGKLVGILVDAEDSFDPSLDRRKSSRVKVYREKKWPILRNISPSQVSGICQRLIQTGLQCVSELQAAADTSRASTTQSARCQTWPLPEMQSSGRE